MLCMSASVGSGGSDADGVFASETTESLMRKVSVQEMMELATRPDPAGRLLLHEELSRAKPDRRVLQELLRRFPERIRATNESKSLPLHVAALNIHTLDKATFELIIEAWPEAVGKPNALGLLPIHKAVMAKLPRSTPPNMAQLERLVTAHPPGLMAKNKEGMTPLHLFINYHVKPLAEIVEFLMEKQPKAAEVIDAYGHTPLHKLVSKKPDEEIINCLTTVIDAFPAALLQGDLYGRVPLHWAVMCRDKPDLEIVAELVENAPQAVNKKDKEGLKPIQRLMSRGNNRCGATCLMLAQKEEELAQKRVGHRKELEKEHLHEEEQFKKMLPSNPKYHATRQSIKTRLTILLEKKTDK